MLLFILVPSILCCVYAWRRRQKYLQGKLPPICVGSWPITGHAHLWLRGLFWPRLLDMQRDCLNQGGVTYLHSGPNSAYTYYAICGPNECTKVANNFTERFLLLEDSMKKIFGEGLAIATGSTWETRRNVLQPIFDQMSSRLDVCNQQAKMLVEKIASNVKQGFFDQTEYLRNAVMEILLLTIYGTIEEKEIEEHKACLHEITDLLFERHRSFLKHKKLVFRLSTLKRRQDESIRILKALTTEIITKKRVQFNKDAEPKTLLDFLLRSEHQGIYTEQNIVDEINGVLFGGYATTVNSLTFIQLMIGSHVDIQERVYTEIQNVLGDSTRHVNFEDLSNCIYLHAAIIEALRLYPAVTTITRKAQSQINIKKYSIDPGSNCLMFIYAMNRHHSWGSDREDFKPERWLDGATNSPIATFGLGRRSCIGTNLALNAIKIILIYLLRDYKVVADHTKLVTKQELLLTPVSGHYIALEKR